MPQLKEFTDNQLVELSEDFAMKNLDDRDDVIFDFEADMKKVMKKINLNKLVANDKKYLKNVKKLIMDIVLQRYLKDIINVGTKKIDNYKDFYLEPANV